MSYRSKKNSIKKYSQKKEKKKSLETISMNESASSIMRKKYKKKKNAYGWNVFNQDTLYKAYDKRLKRLKLNGIIRINDQLVHREKLNISHKPTEKAKEDMITELQGNIKRRHNFQRRRRYYENEQVSWINKRNEVFNRKVSRAFDKYTAEIRANLERGTAL